MLLKATNNGNQRDHLRTSAIRSKVFPAEVLAENCCVPHAEHCPSGTRKPNKWTPALCLSTIQRISTHSPKSLEMLYLIGLGLADETDVTVKGLQLIRQVERVYLEAYTSILLVDTAKLVSLINQATSFNLADGVAHCSRKPTMAVLSSWQTEKWSSHPVTRF